MKTIEFKEITLRKQISSRGGGIEIDLTNLGFKGHKMSAYQNYLGGGLLGAVQSNDTIRKQTERYPSEATIKSRLEYSSEYTKLGEIAEQLKRYLHELTNPEGEWESSSYEDNQSRSVSAY